MSCVGLEDSSAASPPHYCSAHAARLDAQSNTAGTGESTDEDSGTL